MQNFYLLIRVTIQIKNKIHQTGETMKTKLNMFLAIIILPFLTFANVNQVHRIILFGDSLSDQGTYMNFAGQYGGGKFTTNPGKLWIELVSENLKLNISANRLDGFNQPAQILGGLNFAQGGARVTNTVGFQTKVIQRAL